MTVMERIDELLELLRLPQDEITEIKIADSVRANITLLPLLDGDQEFHVVIYGADWRLDVRDYGWTFAKRTPHARADLR